MKVVPPAGLLATDLLDGRDEVRTIPPPRMVLRQRTTSMVDGSHELVPRLLSENRSNTDGTMAVLMTVLTLFCFIWYETNATIKCVQYAQVL
jgi:hypothetical protein